MINNECVERTNFENIGIYTTSRRNAEQLKVNVISFYAGLILKIIP